MAMLYSFPSSVYKDEYSPASLDEMEIYDAPAGGLDSPKAAGASDTVKFRLGVHSMVLHDITVTATVTRLQTGVGTAPNALPSAASSNNAVWTYNTPAPPPFEARWTRTQINVNTETLFSVGFNVGAVPGDYQVTYRVTAAEFQSAATVVQTLTVT